MCRETSKDTVRMKKAKAALLEMRDMGVAAEPTDWLLQEVKKAQAYVVCGCRCYRRCRCE